TFCPGRSSGRQAKKTFPQLGHTSRCWFPGIPPSIDNVWPPRREHNGARLFPYNPRDQPEEESMRFPKSRTALALFVAFATLAATPAPTRKTPPIAAEVLSD